MRHCKHCLKPIHEQARMCPHCQRDQIESKAPAKPETNISRVKARGATDSAKTSVSTLLASSLSLRAYPDLIRRNILLPWAFIIPLLLIVTGIAGWWAWSYERTLRQIGGLFGTELPELRFEAGEIFVAQKDSAPVESPPSQGLSDPGKQPAPVTTADEERFPERYRQGDAVPANEADGVGTASEAQDDGGEDYDSIEDRPDVEPTSRRWETSVDTYHGKVVVVVDLRENPEPPAAEGLGYILFSKDAVHLNLDGDQKPLTFTVDQALGYLGAGDSAILSAESSKEWIDANFPLCILVFMIFYVLFRLAICFFVIFIAYMLAGKGARGFTLTTCLAASYWAVAASFLLEIPVMIICALIREISISPMIQTVVLFWIIVSLYRQGAERKTGKQGLPSEGPGRQVRK
ncbi:MAG: hypothetical protein NUW37_10105 [Planctomycetes bacterium]|nr:hypothetical protein [Planctomycetota bacterium]